MDKKIRVLIVDDSLLIRQVLVEMLSSDPDVEVIGTAKDPYDAREKIKALNPDVLTLDIEMPKMDGIAFLEKIMTLRPMPVVMVSTLTQKGAAATFRALELGAVDYVSKPVEDLNKNTMRAMTEELLTKVKIASQAKVRARAKESVSSVLKVSPAAKFTRDMIAIGASTGGVEALREVLVRFPAHMPPIVVVQHMPARFTGSFAQRLDSMCQLHVCEAKDGQKIEAGTIYIAPGDFQMTVEKNGAGHLLSVKKGEKISGHCPSVDVMFSSVAKTLGSKALGVMLTGMGKDGARGMLEMKKSGAFNIGQNEQTCVVYGMPKEAFMAGAIDQQLPLEAIAEQVVERCTS